MQDARANLYDKKSRRGTIKVELSEDEYTALTGQINDLQKQVNTLTENNKRQLREMTGQHEYQIKKLTGAHEAQMAAMTRRVEGLRKAIRKWRVKAKVEEPGEVNIIAAERKIVRRKDKNVWEYIEQWTVPIEKNPALAREVWAWLDEKKQTQFVERLYFHEKHGWVVVLRMEW